MTPLMPLQSFLQRAKNSPDSPYAHQAHEGRWTTYSYADAEQAARKLAAALQAMGYQQGDHIAILAKNSVEWLISDIALMMGGFISVPIYATAGTETISYILEFSQAKAIFIGKLDDTRAAEQACKGITSIAYPYSGVDCDHEWKNLLETNDPLTDVFLGKPDDIATMLFTSGSTGKPKGVPLSYKNLQAGASNGVITYTKDHNRVLSYLPMAHITERTVVGTASFYCSLEVFFNDSLATFVDDLRHAKVTFFLAVPRIWAKFKAQILAKIPPEQLELQLASEQGPAVAAQLREALGLGEAETFGSGTAPIAPALLKWFGKLGIDIGEGWGMTETSGLNCGNLPFKAEMVGTIGTPCPYNEMKLSDEGEILIRGDNVFTAYYNNLEATNDAFVDGWFRTGDKARIEESGAYVIVGRVKEQFKTAKGKYVVPVPIESLLSANPYIEQICVVGSGMPQPIALVVLGEAAQSIEQDVLNQSLQAIIKEVNEALEKHEQLDGLLVLAEPWTIENEMLTPTMKLKRENIEGKYRHLIEDDVTSVNTDSARFIAA